MGDRHGVNGCVEWVLRACSKQHSLQGEVVMSRVQVWQLGGAAAKKSGTAADGCWLCRMFCLILPCGYHAHNEFSVEVAR